MNYTCSVFLEALVWTSLVRFLLAMALLELLFSVARLFSSFFNCCCSKSLHSGSSSGVSLLWIYILLHSFLTICKSLHTLLSLCLHWVFIIQPKPLLSLFPLNIKSFFGLNAKSHSSFKFLLFLLFKHFERVKCSLCHICNHFHSKPRLSKFLAVFGR